MQTSVNRFLLNERLVSTSRKIELAERGLAILEILLALEFLFQLFGTSYWNPIAALDYIITLPFILPFYGLSGMQSESGLLAPLLETLAAMLVWAIATWAVIGIARARQNRVTFPRLSNLETS